MATLTKSTGTVTLSGAVEKVTFPAVYGWVWVKNMSDGDMFVGLSDGVSAGADGVLAIPAGECGRVQTDGQDSVYLLGSGNALVVAQNYADCPFKVGGKGGEIPDLSVYALKSKYGDTTINVGRKADTEIGFYSTAEGKNTTASESFSHAEGNSTIASGISSHAEGNSTIASGISSHAEGDNAIASGNFSHSGGAYTKALHNYEVAYGCYNESNDDTRFSIGDGTSNFARHNAFEITRTGGKLHDEEIMTQNKISNPNLLINSDFKINQRGASGTIIPDKNAEGEDIHTYFVDRWGIDSGSVTINADGTLTLNGTISQIFENAVGDNVTASVSAGAATYDNSTKTFSITANGEIISWAKLEYGSVATAFVSPEVSTELLKCMRYYEILIQSGSDRAVTGFLEIGKNATFDMKFSVPKRCAPSLTNRAARIIVNTIGSYVAILNNCPVSQVESDAYGMVIASTDPVVSSDPSGYIGVSMDEAGGADLAVDAEIY